MAWKWTKGKVGRVPTDWERVRERTDPRLEALYAWERRCRGYDVFPEPVALEPAFVPYLPGVAAELGGWDQVPQPRSHEFEIAAFQVAPPAGTKLSPSQIKSLFAAWRRLDGPVSLEVIGDAASVRYQVVCSKPDGAVIGTSLASILPEPSVTPSGDALLTAMGPLVEGSCAFQTVEFGIYQPAYQPLYLFENLSHGPHSGLVSVLGSLGEGMAGGVQVLATPADPNWLASLDLLVLQFAGSGQAHPNTTDSHYRRALRYKAASPLWAVVLRVFAAASESSNAGDLTTTAFEACRRIGSAFGYMEEPNPKDVLSNQLVAVEPAETGQSEAFRDVLSRRARRTGVLLSEVELAGLWHPPGENLEHPKLFRFDPLRRALPPYLVTAQGVYLGSAAQPDGDQEPPLVPWPDSFRNRHAYLLGATRMGKSTLLLNLMAQDMLDGRGLCLIDPHGDLALDLLARVPERREADVIYLDLSDTDFPPAIGLMEAADEWERRLLVSDLLAILHRLFAASWGDRLEHLLRHALLTLLADDRPHSLRDIRPLFASEGYREALLSRIDQPDLRAFWRSEFEGYSSGAFSPIFNKLGLLTSSTVVRNIISGTESRLQPRDLIAGRKILIVNLAQSLIGEDNAHFLGALLVSKIQIAAMHNLRQARGKRQEFGLFVDEFQNFVVSSFEKILSEAGKAGLTLVMANQFLEQLADNLQTAILSNVGTLVSFRVSAESGRRLAGEFGGFYGANELTDLERGQAAVRLGKAGDSYMMRTFPPIPPDTLGAKAGADRRASDRSRSEVCRPRAEVEAELRVRDREMEALDAAFKAAREAEKQGRKDSGKSSARPASGPRARAENGKGRERKQAEGNGESGSDAETRSPNDVDPGSPSSRENATPRDAPEERRAKNGESEGLETTAPQVSTEAIPLSTGEGAATSPPSGANVQDQDSPMFFGLPEEESSGPQMVSDPPRGATP